MALTRKMLKAMGIEDEKADEIIEAHAETVDALKHQRDEYKAAADELPKVQKQLDEAKAAAEGAGTDEYKEKYDEEHKAFEDYKKEVQAAKTEREKRSAYRKLLESAGIDPKRLDAVMRVSDLSKVEMDGDSIKDADTLTEAAKREWADFIPTTHTGGSEPATPPDGGGGEPDLSKMTASEYIAYKHSRK